MASKYYLIFLISFLFYGCAEVGTISGGQKDETAPRIIKSSIINGTTNFKSQSIELTFDEFIQLNKPTETIFLVPQHAKIESHLVKKSLKLKMSNELEKNTTYTLYLNAAVKDVTEGNDSLLQFTFSTGPYLDSMKFYAKTSDAFSNQIKSKITVGLFDSIETEKPIYFGQTNQDGFVVLSALKEGTYFCKAFEDINKDLQIQNNEAQDWIFEPIQIDLNHLDTFNIKLSIPRQKDKIKNVKYIPPGLIGLHVPKEMDIQVISINDEELSKDRYWRTNEDSLLIALGNKIQDDFKLVMNSDTFNLRRLEKNKQVKLNPVNITKENELSNLSKFEVMDMIQSIDTNKVTVLNIPDSMKVTYSIGYYQNQITVSPKDRSLKKYLIVFNEGSISGFSGKTNKRTKIELTKKEEREFGSLNVKINKPIEFGILQIVKDEKVIDEQKIVAFDKPVTFNRLDPAEYTFRIINDDNQNGKWDPISPKNRTEAERVYQFTTPIKVRANWEVETVLELNN